MSTVNAPLPPIETHWAEAARGLPSVALCGRTLIGNNWTSDDLKVTCLDCQVRILALLQSRQNTLIQAIAARVDKLLAKR